MLEDKVREIFADMVVLKDPQRSEYFSNQSIPSYMRDWLVMKFSDDNGTIDYESVGRYIKRYIPSREDFEQYKFKMVNGDTVQFLARVRVSVDVKTGKTVFELPDFGGSRGGAGGVVAYDVAEKWQNTLLRESENWGIVTLCWMMDGTPSKPKGLITMIGYKPFCPYDIDLEFYRDARSQFSIHEWIDVIIEAIDYNPDGYLDENGEVSERKKLYFLRRLLPFVEKRVNRIELAPKGTGKSYVFEKISKRGWLISGGTVSRASLIYDNAKKTGGLLTRFDFVGFDEVQSITFEQPGQIQQALKHYMEYGEIKGFDASAKYSVLMAQPLAIIPVVIRGISHPGIKPWKRSNVADSPNTSLIKIALPPIFIKNYMSIRPEWGLIKKILLIGIPSGIENSMFQFGKLAIQSTVSTLGTVAIAAQAMTNILENLNGIAAIGIGIGLMTVVGQCLGAGRKDEAVYYIKKLSLVSEVVIIASCLIIFILTKPITMLAGMEPASARLCFEMVPLSQLPSQSAGYHPSSRHMDYVPQAM